MFVEVFSGSSRLCKAFSRLGYQTIPWNIKLGSSYDLTVRANSEKLRTLLGRAHCIHFAPPCSSFSLAARGRAPRSLKFPWGKENLSPEMKVKVDLANILTRVTVKLTLFCIRGGKIVSFENPRSSRIFALPPVRRIAVMGSEMIFPFCAYGERWQKYTKALFWNCPPLAKLSRQCVSNKGVCQFTLKPHIILQGKNEHGLDRTKEAEPYPKRWCTAFARTVRSYDVAACSRRLETLSES